MNSQQAWEEEYAQKRLMTGDKPAKSLIKWIKQLRKEGIDFSTVRVLDLGSGEGKNALYLAEMGAKVECIEIARNAVETTKNRAREAFLGDSIRVQQGSIGEIINLPDNSCDLVIDVTSSNSLSEQERSIYLSQSLRVLKPGGQMFVRALCKDGDSNAKQLIKDNPGNEYDTYIIPGWGQTERVFTEEDIRDLYSRYFTIKQLEKETHYTNYDGRRYKRNFWVMHLVKPVE